jgi:hypothetical protein
MTAMQQLVWQYVQQHPWTRRSTVVESLSGGERDRAKRIREALDVLCALKVLRYQKEGRSIRYAEKEVCTTQT